MSQQKETERVREIFDASAAQYDKGMAFNEKLFCGDGRAWACSHARGQVLEIAIGTGRNLPFYPADVEITGIEISPAMLEIARQRAQGLGRQVELVIGDAQALPFPDQRFDTVVCTLSLCSSVLYSARSPCRSLMSAASALSSSWSAVISSIRSCRCAHHASMVNAARIPASTTRNSAANQRMRLRQVERSNSMLQSTLHPKGV